MKQDEKIECLTVAQVAEKLQIHWQTVLAYIKNGKIKAFKIGHIYRIPKESLLEFINDNLINKDKNK